jgi:hypothetical protein
MTIHAEIEAFLQLAVVEIQWCMVAVPVLTAFRISMNLAVMTMYNQRLDMLKNRRQI